MTDESETPTEPATPRRTGDADETAIRQLDENTVARIAAGEVVERPASAVKELLENSLDADASRVDVTVEEGGTDLIRVADDGHGMHEADLRAAVREHTTSKIDGLDDLESGVATLGFRGEALHTIGSVSRLTIRSRPRADGDATAGAGTELVYDTGEVERVEPTGCPEGTSVEVTELFANTPARRKFLKTTATEFAHVNRIVTRYALANPDVAVSLTHDDREVFATTGQGDLQAAVLSVYGREVASSMIPVEATADDLPPGPLESVSGLVSHPETNRSSREYLATYVNDRAVTADAIREGIMGAYGTQLGGDRYPFVVCFLEVPGEAVDVNVHPRKREVRFDDDDAVRRQVDSAVESALLEHGLLRSGAPRGRSAPDEARIDPQRSAPASRAADRTSQQSLSTQSEQPTEQGDEDAASSGDGSSISEPHSGTGTTESERDASSTVSDAEPESDSTSHLDSTAGGDTTAPSSETADEPESAGADNSATATASRADRTPESTSTAATEPTVTDSEATDSAPTDSTVAEPAETATTPGLESESDTGRNPSRKFDGPTEQRTLAGDEPASDAGEFDSLPSMRVLGQLHDTYLVCELPDGLALIDQHAADERVNYERLREAFADDPTAQALASPVELELTAAEAAVFDEYADALERLGFYANRVDDRTVAVTTVPAVFAETLEPATLRDVLTSVIDGDNETGAETVDALADEFLGDLACYPSVTGNTSLTEGSVLELLSALDDCENPYACPHGRPVIVRIDGNEIDTRFERDYPGHR